MEVHGAGRGMGSYCLKGAEFQLGETQMFRVAAMAAQ